MTLPFRLGNTYTTPGNITAVFSCEFPLIHDRFLLSNHGQLSTALFYYYPIECYLEYSSENASKYPYMGYYPQEPYYSIYSPYYGRYVHYFPYFPTGSPDQVYSKFVILHWIHLYVSHRTLNRFLVRIS